MKRQMDHTHTSCRGQKRSSIFGHAFLLDQNARVQPFFDVVADQTCLIHSIVTIFIHVS